MPDRNFAFVTVGVAILIIYGSLYPFQFHSRSVGEPLRSLIVTWADPPGRGDLFANLLLYFPLGLFFFPALRRLQTSFRFAVVIGAGMILSAGIELAQLYDAGRQSAMSDVYANTAGTVLGSAAGAVLFATRRGSNRPETVRRPFIVLLLCSWLGYRLAPFVPAIDLHKYWDALKPLVFSPALPPLDFCRHIVIVLVVAVSLEALFGTARSRLATAVLVFSALLARVLIVGIVLSPAEVAGSALGVVAWTFLSRWRYRASLVAALFAGVIVIQALEPFHFSPPARPFGWVPFLGFLQGSVEVNVRSFFEKVFTYGSLVWLVMRAGASFTQSAGFLALLVLCLRLLQTFLPGRSAEITDVILVLIMAAILKLTGEEPAQDSGRISTTGWLDACLYENLTRSDTPEAVDLIFVLAGRMERKLYGLELFRAGFAPRLLLSVGRFEVSRMHTLGIAGIDRLTALRDQTPPEERNFFVELDAAGVQIEKSQLPRSSTYGEALGLRAFLAGRQVPRVMVISTDVHLRRVALAFDRVFRELPIEFLYCPVPARFGFLDQNGWWSRPADRRFVLREFVKLLGYRAILMTPEWAVRRFMRVTRVPLG